MFHSIKFLLIAAASSGEETDTSQQCNTNPGQTSLTTDAL